MDARESEISIRSGGKNAFTSCAAPSLADVAALIREDDQVSSSRRAAVGSAINSLCRWSNLPATAIPAHPEFLRRLFAGFSPAAAQATPKRVSNVKSELLFALRHLGLLAGGSYLAPLTPEWQALWSRLPDKYARTALSRFFRYCSAQDVPAALVTDAVAAAFLALSRLRRSSRSQGSSIRTWPASGTACVGRSRAGRMSR